MRARRALPVLLCAAALAPGCRSTYTERLARVHRAFYAGDVAEADRLLAASLDGELADADLLRLERAMVLQARGEYARAAALLVTVDDRMETLDYTRAPIAELADALFALQAIDYRTSPVERLLLNAQNMINFLALGEHEEAAVEARRARVLLLQEEARREPPGGAALAWALAGLAFEFAGKDDDARRSYLASGRAGLPPRPEPGEGTLVVVVQNGQAPVRVEAGAWIWIGGLVHLVQFPALVERWPGFTSMSVAVDGAPAGNPETLLDLRRLLVERYRRELPRLIAAAVLQMIPRVVTTEALRRELTEGSHGDEPLAHAAAFAVGWIVESLMAGLTPVDTRSWTTLPAEVRLLRLEVPAGRHRVEVRLGGVSGRQVAREVEVRAGELALLNVVTAIGAGGDAPPGALEVRVDRALVHEALRLVPGARVGAGWRSPWDRP